MLSQGEGQRVCSTVPKIRKGSVGQERLVLYLEVCGEMIQGEGGMAGRERCKVNRGTSQGEECLEI